MISGLLDSATSETSYADRVLNGVEMEWKKLTECTYRLYVWILSVR
jgi:hypothetical protein